jgi:hypothetical protein
MKVQWYEANGSGTGRVIVESGVALCGVPTIRSLIKEELV